MFKTKIQKWVSFLVDVVVMTVFSSILNVSLTSWAAYENSYVNTGNQADDIVGVARTQIGYHEIGDNYTKYNEWFGSLSGMGYNYAWCQTFVAWCANQAEISTNLVPRVSGTISGMDFFKNKGTWYNGPYYGTSYIPKKGDIIYFKSGSSSSGYHVGIVSDVSDGTVYTIEGNSSDKVSTRSYSVSNSTIVGYGCPNYKSYPVSDLNPPINVALSKNQIWYDIKDTITLNATADNATTYWISVLKDGTSVINTQISGELSFSASDYGYGDYHAWVSAVNSAGSTDSNHVDFSVVGAATYTNVYVSQNCYSLNNVVSISVDTICAKGQVIGIDRIEDKRVITEECESTYVIEASKLGIGKYSAYFSVYNGSGGVDTERVEFSIYDKLISPTPTIKTLSSSSLELTWEVEPNATSYRIDRRKANTDAYETIATTNDTTYIDTGLEADTKYWYRVYAISGSEKSSEKNSVSGTTAPNIVNCNIKLYDEGQCLAEYAVPSGKELDEFLLPTISKSGYQFNGWYTEKNGGEEYKIGSIIPNIENLNLYAQWEKIEIKGDINNDGQLNTTDIIILQKWLLQGKIELANWKSADMNNDGMLNIFDFCLMKQMLINT